MAEASGPQAGQALPEPGQRGRLQVSDRVVEKIAARAALSVHGVPVFNRRGSSRLPKARTELSGGHANVVLDIAITWPHPADEIGLQVRHAVRRDVESMTPFTADQVDVRVRQVVSELPRERVQ